METLIKGIIYCQTVPLGHCMSGFSAFVLNLSKSDNVFFRSMPKGHFLFNSASIVIGRYIGDNSPGA